MSGAIWDTLKVFFAIIGGIGLVVFAFYGLPTGLGPSFGALSTLFGLALNVWALYAFVRYRQGRQEELLKVLTAAVEANLPLATAIQAYNRDRPRPGMFRQSLFFLAFIVLPLYGYIRLWIGWRPYHWLLNEFSYRLQLGQSLTTALGAVPAVASREARLAAEVGEATGALGLCLNTVDRTRQTFNWLEVLPPLLYPLFVLFIVSGITTFLMVAIIPKYVRIFEEFKMSFPEPTESLVDFADGFAEFLPVIQGGVWFTMFVVAAAIAVPTFRWHLPLVGRLYRWTMQAQVLRALGRFLDTGQPAPTALGSLAESEALPVVVRNRLVMATGKVSTGEPLAESLQATGLLPTAMVPLVQSAQRTNTLSWALSELGDHLVARAYRLVRRVTLIVSPLTIIAVGCLVTFIALGMFLPLITLIDGLSQ